jgi:uncharacterized protein YceH (UPF0502 family)
MNNASGSPETSLAPRIMLSVLDARVLGCLLEKELATPDVYPLSLNGLVNACNQKSNRSPVLEVGAREVEVSIEALRTLRLVSVVSEADARVMKFRHTAADAYPVLDTVARAVLAELLLRGPQTTAELRARAGRLAPLPELSGVDALLFTLASPESGVLTRKLARQPGKKEARWAQLLSGEPALEEETAGTPAEPLKVCLAVPPELTERLAALEAEVASLRGELKTLRAELGA